ncbi:MAG: TolC family protein [Ramlibacter sp.]
MDNMTHAGRAMQFTATAIAVLALAGCASFSADGGFGKVAELTHERTGQTPLLRRSDADAASASARVAELLRAPLSADAAVELAFLNNRGLQAQFAELGIAEADLVRAGRLRNPSLGFGRLAGGGDVEIDRAVLFDVLGLLTLPARTQLAQRGFEQAQFQAADDAVGLAAEVRRAYFGAVASQQLVAYAQQVKDAASASSELARRMREAGNFSTLAQMRQQAFDAEATAQLARARNQAAADRERLVRLLGLSGEQVAFRLPGRLPELPDEPAAPRDAQQAAIDRRLDVLMARRAAEATARSLGLTRATRMVNVLEAGYQNRSESGRPRANGYEVQLELPLFDFGTASVSRAEATYLQAADRAAAVAVNAQSEVRESYAAYRTAHDLARHYRDEVVPLRQRIADENLLRYNGMLVSVFELLADARDQVAAVTGAIQALRDFWIADTNLQTAIAGRSPGRAAGKDTP